MDIRQFRVVLRAKSFETTCRFYGESLALPRVQSWDREDAKGAVFQAGPALLEVQGRPVDARQSGRDEIYDYQGPNQKMVLTFLVPSAEEAYRELLFRDKNIPGGLRHDADGSLVFETHDPDGVRVVYRQAES